MRVAAHRRHQAEERQAQAAGDVFRRLDRVVHVVEAVGDGDRQGQTRAECHKPRPAAGDGNRAARRLGVIDHADVVLPAVD